MRKWFICLFLIFSFSYTSQAHAFSKQVIQRGAVGDDVIELQARLQYLGFYRGKIDGVFGWRTYWALRKFQYKFKLPVDGLAGETTKQKLVRASKYYKSFVYNNLRKGNTFTHYGGVPLSKQVKARQTKTKNQATAAKATNTKQMAVKRVKSAAVNVPNGFSQNDIQLMANAVHGEARGEPYIGQVAVAAVILNRINSPSFPNTVAGVILSQERLQLSQTDKFGLPQTKRLAKPYLMP